MTSPPSGQSWNAAAYAANGRFVADLASGAVNLLAPRPGERILDLGCGDGALTQQIAATGALVTGVDLSPGMVEAARARGLTVHLADIPAITWAGEFNAAFSNAALHWIPASRQPGALAAIHRALIPGGRFIAEMGGLGNIASIRVALQATLDSFGIDAEYVAASFYPSPAHYRKLLEEASFEVQSIDLIPRPTPLPGGVAGMGIWLNTFRNGVLDKLPTMARAEALEETVSRLAPVLQDPLTQSWTADYVRLRFHAIRD